MFNGMRQFIAVCLCFACTSLMLKKKYMPMILLILLASTIQGKASNKKTIFLIAMTLLAIVFVERFTSLLDILTDGTQYEGFLDSEVMVNDNGTNPIRVLVFSVPAIISFMYRKKYSECK